MGSRDERRLAVTSPAVPDGAHMRVFLCWGEDVDAGQHYRPVLPYLQSLSF